MTEFEFFDAREILREIEKGKKRIPKKAELNKITRSKAARWLEENKHNIENSERSEGYKEGYLVIAIAYKEKE